MKKIFILLSLAIIFIIPFSCSRNEVTDIRHDVEVIKNSYCTIDLHSDPAIWTYNGYSIRPDHAETDQIFLEPSRNCHVYLYKPDTSYTGGDYVSLQFVSSGENKKRRDHKITITVVDE